LTVAHCVQGLPSGLAPNTEYRFGDSPILGGSNRVTSVADGVQAEENCSRCAV
jgi:hypothetical protein